MCFLGGSQFGEVPQGRCLITSGCYPLLFCSSGSRTRHQSGAALPKKKRELNGDWLVVWIIFLLFHKLGIIIPTD